MKQIVCEMCGSSDLIKQDGVFVCQFCGCKYSVEEARKLMIDGTVDIKGTVQIDNSAYVQKYLENARRAKEKEDWEETEKYYNMVEQNEPDNIEAIFYSAYAKAKASLLDGDIYKREAAFKVLTNCVSIIDDKYQIDAKDNQAVIQGIAQDICRMIGGSFVYNYKTNEYGWITTSGQPNTYQLFVQLVAQFEESLLNIAEVDKHSYLYATLKTVYNTLLSSLRVFESNLKKYQADYQKSCRNYVRTVIARINDKLNVFEINYNQLKKIEEEIIAKEKAEKLEKYWAEHSEEKALLEDEKAGLYAQVKEIEKEMDQVPGQDEIDKFQATICELQKEKSSFGLFKIKEKKAVQDKIDATTAEIQKVILIMNADKSKIQDRITPLQNRIDAIVAELTADR